MRTGTIWKKKDVVDHWKKGRKEEEGAGKCRTKEGAWTAVMICIRLRLHRNVCLATAHFDRSRKYGSEKEARRG